MSQLKQKPDDYINVTIELDDVDITSAETKATYEEIEYSGLGVHAVRWLGNRLAII